MTEFQIVIQAITEEAKTKIPDSIRTFYQSAKNRQIIAKKRKDTFLDDKRLKFPVRDLEGQYNCALIYAAYMRAKINAQRSIHGRLKTNLGGGYYERIGKKAKELFSGCGCSKELHIKLNQEDIGQLDFIEFSDLMQIDEGMLIDSDFENDIDI